MSATKDQPAAGADAPTDENQDTANPESVTDEDSTVDLLANEDQDPTAMESPADDGQDATDLELSADEDPPSRTLEGELPLAVREALEAMDEHKGEEMVVLDMRASGFTDFMVMCNGGSNRHTQALADAVEERLLRHKIKRKHVEGKREGHWILIDYIDLVVHLFTPEAREFYQLEKLWRDAPMLEWHGAEAE